MNRKFTLFTIICLLMIVMSFRIKKRHEVRVYRSNNGIEMILTLYTNKTFKLYVGVLDFPCEFFGIYDENDGNLILKREDALKVTLESQVDTVDNSTVDFLFNYDISYKFRERAPMNSNRFDSITINDEITHQYPKFLKTGNKYVFYFFNRNLIIDRQTDHIYKKNSRILVDIFYPNVIFEQDSLFISKHQNDKVLYFKNFKVSKKLYLLK